MDVIMYGKIVKICNGEEGYQPEIIVMGEDKRYYLVTATPERKFMISLINESDIFQ